MDYLQYIGNTLYDKNKAIVLNLIINGLPSIHHFQIHEISFETF